MLASPQHSLAGACIAFEGSYRRIRDNCMLALVQSGTSTPLRLSMLDSLGWAHYHLDDEEAAADVFRQMLALDRGSGDALSGLGWLAYDAGDYATAGGYFERAMLRMPNAQVLAGFAASRHRTGGIGTAEALTLIDMAVAMKPDYAWALRRKGWILEAENRLEDAASAFAKALQINRRDAWAAHGLAHVLGRQSRWQDALPFANLALTVQPRFAAALSRRSLIYFNLNRPEPALKDADAVVALSPDWDEGYVRKARALSRLGRREDALEVLARADERLGFDSFVVYWRAKLLFDGGRHQDALFQIDRNIAASDGDYYDYLLKSRIALALKDKAVARPAIDRALTLRPGDKWAMFYDALVLVAEDRFERAEEEMSSAIGAGLHRDKLKDFIAALVAKNRQAQADRLRRQYLARD